DTLTNAWGGGLNYVQVSDFDYDFDGDMDLFLFDRSNNNIRVYTQEDQGGTKFYQLAYGSKVNFPSDVRYRAAMVDYDNDGRKDLWTYGIGGIKVYRNVGSIGTGLQWVLASDLLISEYVNGSSQLFVSQSDIPAIVDVDFDGDMDVLTFHQGGKNMEYHQNQSMELYNHADSLVFILQNECWGIFGEEPLTNNIILNDTDFPCTGSNISNPLRTGEGGNNFEGENANKHAGSTVLAIDINNSGVYDLIIGDVSYPNLNLLTNGGLAPNTNSSMISVDGNFPSNTTPADIQLFPASFYVDVDFDGVRDLIVTANVKNISENETSVRYYKNIGTDALPNFIFTANDLFQNEMVEHGTGTVPVIFDFDEDGLDDLIIGNFFRYIPTLNKESTIAYYKNTGTANAPEFTYIDYNLFNLDQENFGLRSIPTFGDIDGDGDEDMFLGMEDGSLVYYQNNSIGAGAVFGSPQVGYLDNNAALIASFGYTHPQLFDLDDDGLVDLILGSKTGEIHYYRNIGTVNAPSFELTNEQLGNIDIVSNKPDVYAAPHFFRINNETKLFLGSELGQLIYYDSIDNNLGTGEPFHMVSDHYLSIDVEAFSSFAVKDIDNDGNLNMFVGQDLGGVFHFEADPNSEASVTQIELHDNVALFPNPSSNSITIASSESNLSEITIIDLSGKVVKSVEVSNASVSLDILNLSKGIYVVKITLYNGNVVTKKLVKR
ncbi:MAG: T9SS type A sorting domain-containing protein, partial [Crocinitomicaceae bacterium]|nr:T9SS type A sorting domain-containing protein [Crocinitomicaceae bacterium]